MPVAQAHITSRTTGRAARMGAGPGVLWTWTSTCSSFSLTENLSPGSTLPWASRSWKRSQRFQLAPLQSQSPVNRARPHGFHQALWSVVLMAGRYERKAGAARSRRTPSAASSRHQTGGWTGFRRIVFGWIPVPGDRGFCINQSIWLARPRVAALSRATFGTATPDVMDRTWG